MRLEDLAPGPLKCPASRDCWKNVICLSCWGELEHNCDCMVGRICHCDHPIPSDAKNLVELLAAASGEG